MSQNHEEYSYLNGNDAVIVFVHGILGTPNLFRFLAENLKKKYDCEALLLPGHGGTAWDFSKTPGKEWVTYAHQRIEQIRSHYKRLYLVGHSMGGLLCLQYAAESDIDGLVVINSPLVIKVTPTQLFFRSNLRRNTKCEEIVSVYEQNNGVTGRRFYTYPFWIRQYMGLFGIMHNCRRNIGSVKSPALIIQSVKDETVHVSNARLLQMNLNAQEGPIYLPQSHHAYFSPPDRQTLLTKTAAFLGAH